MRRVLTVTGVLALAAMAVGVGPARADQNQCVQDLPFNSKVCVETTNSAGADGDEHRLTVTANQSVPGLALGLNPHVNCDDGGGTSDAIVRVNVGPDAFLILPAPCPELP